MRIMHSPYVCPVVDDSLPVQLPQHPCQRAHQWGNLGASVPEDSPAKDRQGDADWGLSREGKHTTKSLGQHVAELFSTDGVHLLWNEWCMGTPIL